MGEKTIYERTMHTNPTLFKGLYFQEVISEEIGLNEDWFEFFNNTKNRMNMKQLELDFYIGSSLTINISPLSWYLKPHKTVYNSGAVWRFLFISITKHKIDGKN